MSKIYSRDRLNLAIYGKYVKESVDINVLYTKDYLPPALDLYTCIKSFIYTRTTCYVSVYWLLFLSRTADSVMSSLIRIPIHLPLHGLSNTFGILD